MCKDEILEEIHKIREEHAQAFNYDLQAICDDLRLITTDTGINQIILVITATLRLRLEMVDRQQSTYIRF
jgi:hypothetical protein